MSGTHPHDEREAILRRHLRDLEDTELLPDGEELAAAALVVDGRRAENELAVAASCAVADLDAATGLRVRVRRGEAARAALIGSTRRLVVSLARRHDADAAHTVALLTAGDAALSRAVDRYDPTGGLAFSAFARWWVERAMREVEHHPTSAGPDGSAAAPADPTLLTALGHLHRNDCRVIELRLGLNGSPPLSRRETAQVLGSDLADEERREDHALAKLRHPCTPGNLANLRRL